MRVLDRGEMHGLVTVNHREAVPTPSGVGCGRSGLRGAYAEDVAP